MNPILLLLGGGAAAWLFMRPKPEQPAEQASILRTGTPTAASYAPLADSTAPALGVFNTTSTLPAALPAIAPLISEVITAAPFAAESTPSPLSISDSKVEPLTVMPDLPAIAAPTASFNLGAVYAAAPKEAFTILPELFAPEIKAASIDPTEGYHTNVQAPVTVQTAAGPIVDIIPVLLETTKTPAPTGQAWTPFQGLETYVPPTQFKDDAPAEWVNATTTNDDAFAYYANLFMKSIGLA